MKAAPKEERTNRNLSPQSNGKSISNIIIETPEKEMLKSMEQMQKSPENSNSKDSYPIAEKEKTIAIEEKDDGQECQTKSEGMKSFVIWHIMALIFCSTCNQSFY